MVVARIEFKPGQGKHFCEGANQDVVEVLYESPEALVEVLKAFEPYIYNCTARVGKKVLDLRKVSGLPL